MHRALTAVGLGLTVAVMGGCYESKVPLGDSHESKVEPELLGDWSGKFDSDTVRVVVRKFSEHEYFITFAFGDDDAVLTRAYATEIEGARLMNFQNIDSAKAKERTFVFARYELTDDGAITVRFLNKKPLLEGRRFESPKAFRQFVKEHLEDEKLYTKPVRLHKAKDLAVKIEPDA